MKIIALVNHKGGVGKTTTTLNLGKALSLLGKKVLMIDNDPQANLTVSTNKENYEPTITEVYLEEINLPIVKVSENYDLVVASLSLAETEGKLQTDVNGYFKLKKAIAKLENKYDYVLIDCPPSLGILTINAMIVATEVLVVVQSQFLAVKGLTTIVDLVEKLREYLNPTLYITGLLLTQIGRNVITKSIIEAVREAYPHKVFETTIRQNIALAEASAVCKDIFSYNSKSIAAEDYLNLAKEITL